LTLNNNYFLKPFDKMNYGLCIFSYTDEASCGQIRIVKSFYKNKPLVGLQPWVVGGTVGKKGESPWQVGYL